MKTPNDIVNEYLEKYDIKQKACAQILNITQAAVSKMLGKDDMPVGALIKLSEAFNYDFLHEISKQYGFYNLTQWRATPFSEIEVAILNLMRKNINQLK